MKVTTRLTLGALVTALLVFAAFQVGRPPGAESSSRSAPKPKSMISTPDPDGRKQVVIQLWWEPSSSGPSIIYEIDQLSPPERRFSGHGAGASWIRRGWARPGSRVYVGWAFAPDPVRTLSYRIWVSASMIDSGSTTRQIGAVNQVVP